MKELKKGMELGAVAYIVKPFDPDDLLSTVNKFLSAAKV